MLSLRSPLAAPACAASQTRTRSVVARASSMRSMEEFDSHNFSSAAMSLLSQRIKDIQSAVSAEDSFQDFLQKRPPVPTGVSMMMWEEMQADHKLLCNWHEAAWKALQQGQQQQQQEP